MRKQFVCFGWVLIEGSPCGLDIQTKILTIIIFPIPPWFFASVFSTLRLLYGCEGGKVFSMMGIAMIFNIRINRIS